MFNEVQGQDDFTCFIPKGQVARSCGRVKGDNTPRIGCQSISKHMHTAYTLTFAPRGDLRVFFFGFLTWNWNLAPPCCEVTVLFTKQTWLKTALNVHKWQEEPSAWLRAEGSSELNQLVTHSSDAWECLSWLHQSHMGHLPELQAASLQSGDATHEWANDRVRKKQEVTD